MMSTHHRIEQPSADASLPDLKVATSQEADASPQRPKPSPVEHHRRPNESSASPEHYNGQPGISSGVRPVENIKKEEDLESVPNIAMIRLRARHEAQTDGKTNSEQLLDTSSVSESVPREFRVEHEQRLRDQGFRSPFLESEPNEIERPRSALHTGDFFHKQVLPPSRETQSPTDSSAASPIRPFLSLSPTTPWHTPAVPSFLSDLNEPQSLTQSRPVGSRSRAPSLGSSLSSSFIFRPPTSPLVHAASNVDQDSSNPNTLRHGSSPERNSRRRTLPPDSFHSFRSTSSGVGGPPNFSRPLIAPRREPTFPCQAHQPRRSLTSTSTNHSLSSPQTPTLPRSRRPSLSSDCSPIQHASMVGSFEESILRGRMSTAPSKPLDFVAQIGVLGRGDCKATLRCPAHVVVPFPAVFYSYPSIGARTFSDDSPSPYVGTIDLERSLKPIESKKTRSTASIPAQSIDALVDDVTAPANTHIGQALDRRKRERQRKRPTCSKGPLGGCYRVPQQGQIQIVIKNPNKTAVKLFLVPYNLDRMEAGTKTFLRQRSFSAGPVLEKPLTDSANSALPDPLQHKSILRYLIHLKLCCPSKGKYYLYDNIRLVFANRVPDGKENLRNEIQLPEPRYSSYRPSRDHLAGKAGAKLAAEIASKRQSSGFGLAPAASDAMDGVTYTGPPATLPCKPSSTTSADILPMLPFHPGSRYDSSAPVGVTATVDQGTHFTTDQGTLATTDPAVRPMSPSTSGLFGRETRNLCKAATSHTAGFVPSISRRASPVPWSSLGLGGSGLDADVFPRGASPTSTDSGEGLLARELRSIDAQQARNGNGQ